MLSFRQEFNDRPAPLVLLHVVVRDGGQCNTLSIIALGFAWARLDNNSQLRNAHLQVIPDRNDINGELRFITHAPIITQKGFNEIERLLHT